MAELKENLSLFWEMIYSKKNIEKNFLRLCDIKSKFMLCACGGRRSWRRRGGGRRAWPHYVTRASTNSMQEILYETRFSCLVKCWKMKFRENVSQDILSYFRNSFNYICQIEWKENPKVSRNFIKWGDSVLGNCMFYKTKEFF